MSELVGTSFKYNGTDYMIDRVDAFDSRLTHVCDAMKKNGKDAAIFLASKILKSGRKSKQGAAFYRFSKTGRFIKAL